MQKDKFKIGASQEECLEIVQESNTQYKDFGVYATYGPSVRFYLDGKEL